MKRLSRAALVLGLAVASISFAATAGATDKRECARTSEAGQRSRAEGHLHAARDRFRVCAQEECPDVVRHDCVVWLEEIEAALPSVVFAVTDENGNDVHGAQILVDGQVVGADGKAFSLDPGSHAVRAVLANGRAVEKEIQVAEGVKRRLVALALPPSSDASSAAAPPAPVAAAEAPSRTLGWVLGGTGVAVLGVTAYLGLSGLSRAHDLESSCKPNCDPTDVDDLRTRFRVSYVTGAVGGLLVAAGIYFVVFPLGASRTTAVGAGPGRANLTVRF